MKPAPSIRSLLALTGGALLTISYAHATNLYWDSNSTTAGAGATPTGTWGVDNFWNTDSTGGAGGAFQTATLGTDDLFFSAGTDAVNPYTVGLNSATQNARLVTFEDGTGTLDTGTLSLGNGGGITVTSGTVTGATISSNLTITGSHTFNVAAGRILTLDTGTFTRNAGATLNVASTGTVTTTMTGLATGSLVNGIIGPWASFGSGASTTYATIDGSNNIVGLGYTGGADGTSAANAAALTTSATTNFTFAGGAGTLGGNSFNTLRHTGSGGTMAGAFTANGIMNVSGSLLTFSGGVTSGTGEMVIHAANGGITLSSTLNNNGNLVTITGSGNTTVTGVISGAGGLFKSGTGTLTLSSNASTYAGQLTVANGTLSISSINNVSANGTLGNSALPVILGSSGNTGTLSYTGGNVTSTKRFTFAAGGTGEINVSTGATTLTLSGLIDGTGNLLKTGAGTLTLSNNPNQFTGNTVITNGKVALGNQYAMWQSAYDTTGSTGAIGLNVTGYATPWLGGLAGSVNLATAITGYGSVTSLTLNPQSGSSVSYGGVIANGAANMTLNKTGHGTQTLTGANSYSGATTVWAGILSLSGASGTALNSAFTVRGGTLELDNSTNLVASRLTDGTALSLGSLTLKGFNTGGVQGETVGATTFAVGGKVTVINGSTAGDRTTFAMGAVTRSTGAAIDFVGGGLGTLGGGANSPNVTTTGTFPGGSNGILPWATVNGTTWAGTASTNSIVAYAGAFVDPTSAASNSANNAQLTGTGSIATAKNFNSLNLITSGSGESLNLASGANLNLTSGAILKSGTDAYTISSSGGILGAGAGAGTELIAHVNGGALTISAPLDTDINNIAKGGTGDLILSGTRAGTMTGNISIAGGQLEFQGASLALNTALVTGAGGLTVNLNAGQTLSLSNNSNSYAGPTIVKGGYLTTNGFGNQGLPGGIGSGGPIPGTNTSQIMSNLQLQGGVFYATYTFNKDLGAGPGQVQVLAGTSGFVNTANSGGAAGFVLDGGRELVWGSTYFNPTVFVHSLNTTANLTLNLANGFDLNGSTRTILVGDATYNGANGVSQLGGNIRTSSGTAGLTKTGIGTLLLSGTNTYNGATTISSGTLRFSNQVSLYNNTPASWTAANIVVANTGTLALNVGGAGQFTTGNVTTLLTNLGGANGTSTTGFAAGSSIGFDTTNAAGNTFTVADNIADSSGAGGGAIGVQKLGSNTLVLSGTNNSYSGATIVYGGTLSLTGSLTGGTAITTTSNTNGAGGSPPPAGVLNQSATGVISGASSITQSSTGFSTLSGTNTYSAGTSITAGTLQFTNLVSMPATGTVAVNGGTLAVGLGGTGQWTTGASGNGTLGGLVAASAVGGQGNTVTWAGNSAVGFDTTNASGLQTYSGNIVNRGTSLGVTKLGLGALTLSGTNTYTGTTTVNAGTLNMSGTFGNHAITVNGGLLNFTSSSGGNGAITVNGGTFRYAGTKTAGSINNTAGTLQIGTANASGLGAITIGSGNFATISSDSTTARTITNRFVMNGSIVLGDPVNNGKLTFSDAGATSTTGSAARAVTVLSDAEFTTGLSGTGGITKDGAATLTLSGANSTYSSTTTVNRGLFALGNGGNLTGATNVTVNGGTFGIRQNASGTTNSVGSGASTFTLATGSALSMADGFYSTFNRNGSGATSLAPASGAGVVSPVLTFDLIGANGDLFAITGAATAGTAGARIAISSTSTPTAGSAYTVITGGAGSALSTNFSLANSLLPTASGLMSLSLSTSTATAATVSVANAANAVYWTGASSPNIANGANWNTSIAGGVVFGVTPTNKDLTFSTTTPGVTSQPTTSASALTVNSVNFLPGVAATTINGGNLLTVSTNINDNSSTNQTINTALSVAGNINKTGSGTLALTGSNTISGTTFLDAGTLLLSNANAITSTSGITSATTSAVSVASGTTIELRANANTNFNTGLITLPQGTVNIDVDNNGSGSGNTLTLGTASVAVSGINVALTTAANASTTLNITGGNSYGLSLGRIQNPTSVAGTAFTVNAGTVPVAITQFQTGSFGSNFIAGSGTITLGTPSISAIAQGSNGSNTVTVNSGATLIMAGGVGSYNSRAGGNYSMVLNSGGTLVLNSAAALSNTGGTATPSFTINGGTLDNTTASALTVSGNPAQTWNGDFTFTGTQSLNLGTGAVALVGDRTVTVSANTLTVGGSISGAGLTKEGAGTLTLSAANTYTGATAVNAGTLLINGSTVAGSTVSVASGAILGGTGTIAGAVNVTGSLSPGASIETLGTGTLSFANGSTLVHELDSSVATSVGSDLLKVTGNLNLAGTVGLNLSDIATTDVAFAVNDIFSLINYTGAWNNGLFTFGVNELADEEEFVFGLNTWRISYDDAVGGLNYNGEYAGGSDSFVNLTVVNVIPEPRTALLGTLGALMLLRRRRRN